MKKSHYILFVVIGYLFSCINKSEKNDRSLMPDVKAQTINLVDSLGRIEISLPIRYDTFLKWVDYSDCGKPCNQQKYRFQPKNIPVSQESGFIWKGDLVDAVDRLTISHSQYIPFEILDTGLDLVRDKHWMGQEMAALPNFKVNLDTIECIKDRCFSVFAMQIDDSIHTEKVIAITTVRGNRITFDFLLRMKTENSIYKEFVRNSLKFIQTIKFSQKQ